MRRIYGATFMVGSVDVALRPDLDLKLQLVLWLLLVAWGSGLIKNMFFVREGASAASGHAAL